MAGDEGVGAVWRSPNNDRLEETVRFNACHKVSKGFTFNLLALAVRGNLDAAEWKLEYLHLRIPHVVYGRDLLSYGLVLPHHC